MHTHLDSLDVSHTEALDLSRQAGLSHLITISTGPDDLAKILLFATSPEALDAPKVFCTLGYHPHEAKKFSKEDLAFIKASAPDPRVVAIGEIGLDYYYNHSESEKQKEVFRTLMEVAAVQKLPVQIHTRDAEADTIEILKEFAGRVHGILHCFSGSQELADAALALGYNLSISGILTFKNADDLREIVKNTPIDRLHIETDSPYLTPVPFRGKKNQPSYVVKTAEVMAQLKGLGLEQLKEQLFNNTMKMFGRMNV